MELTYRRNVMAYQVFLGSTCMAEYNTEEQAIEKALELRDMGHQPIEVRRIVEEYCELQEAP